MTLLLTNVLLSAFIIQPAKAEWTGTVYIRADGSVDPPDAPIITYDNVTYTLTDNITSSGDGIVVQRDNVIVDGAGYAVQGEWVLWSSGISLTRRSNVTIKNMNIKAFCYGVLLNESSNNIIISGNDIAYNYNGILLSKSSNNIISYNNITANLEGGILLLGSSNNVIRNNNFEYDGLFIEGDLVDCIQIIEGNIVNGKPLYYFLSQKGIVLDSVNVGQLILVNSTYFVIKNLSISHTDIGIQLLYSSNNIISENNVTANKGYGIYLDYSSNNSISRNNIANNEWGIGLGIGCSSNNIIKGNNVTNNYYGISLGESSNNVIGENNVTNNRSCGISLHESSSNIISRNDIVKNYEGLTFGSSSSNTVSGNNIGGNNYGISLCGSVVRYSSNNTIFHNNFMNNTKQASISLHCYANLWDDSYPSGGNYWSDYADFDADSDGIGDEPYTIDANNIDRYPLAGSINVFDAGTWDGIAYNVEVVSNSSTVSGFRFNPSEGAFLRFSVTGDNETAGFCRVTIPKNLLWVENGWTILVGGQQVNYTLIPNENSTYLYFTYTHSTKTVEIRGTHVIPEFPLFTILPLPMLTTLVTTTFQKRKTKFRPPKFFRETADLR